MEILLNGSDWRFKGFVPHAATWTRVYENLDWSSWRTATVPGNAQLDLLSHGLIEDPYVDLNSRNCEWVPQRQWAYAKKFLLPHERKGKRIRLIFDGVDYAANFYLNGEHLGYHENLFIPVEFDVTERLKYGDENSLMVIVEAAPDEQSQIGWTSKTKTMKPRMPYGWDFCTRCVPVGIWRDVKLAITGDAWINDCWAHTSLNDDFSSGSVIFRTALESAVEMDVTLKVDVQREDGFLSSSVSELRATAGCNSVEVEMAFDNPHLWWPNGYGSQNVYSASVVLLDRNGEVLDERIFNFGFKSVKLLPNPGLSDKLLPWSFEVNGRRVFIKGWNWVPVDHLYGGDCTARYERLIRLAKEANVNLLRVWGGGIIEKERFYDLCDRHGIMVWQEFTLSSSGMDDTMPSDPVFIDLLRKTAESVVPQRRNHVSHTVWCGGNELTWKGEEDAGMRAEREVCNRLDPGKLFIPTSPIRAYDPDELAEVERHGHWQFLGPQDHYSNYNNLLTAFHSEFGAEGCANWENVPKFIHEANLLPANTAKNEIWSHRGDWWCNYPKLVELFGEFPDVKALFHLSQFVQWEALRYILESGRRRKYACGGTIPWQFNEPWPNLSCTNCVDFYGIPKQAYYAVQNCYAQVLVSAKYDKLGWRPGETFSAELWVTNSGKGTPGVVEYSLTDLHGTSLVSGQFSPDIPENGSRRAGRVEWSVPEGFEQLFLLHITAVDQAGEQLAENYYLFSSAAEPIFSEFLSLPEARLRALGSELVNGEPETELYISLLNEGNVYALFVRAIPEDNRTDVYFRNNYVIIPPGAKATIRASLTRPVSKFTLAGWNTQTETIP